MAQIPIPAVTPLWEHPSSEIRKLSTWHQQMEIMFHLTNCQRPADRPLNDVDKNNLMYAHLGAEAIRRFEHNPMMAQITTASNSDFYKAIVDTFDQPTPQAVAFFKFRTCKQLRDESATEFLSRLRTLQAECKYDNFDANTDIAYTLAQNCYSSEVQKRLFTLPTVSLESYLNVMQAVENADRSSATVRGDNRAAIHALYDRVPRNRSPARTTTIALTTRCRGCGSSSHAYLSEQCKAKGQTCNSCGRRGHFAKLCEQRGRSPQRPKPTSHQSSVRRVIMRTVALPHSTPYRCTLRVRHANGRDCFFEGNVDSGADVSIIPFDAFKRHIDSRLDTSSVELCNFDGSPIHGLRGQFTATVEYNDRRATSTFIVLDTVKFATWGTDIIEALGLVIDGKSRSINVVSVGSCVSGTEDEVFERRETEKRLQPSTVEPIDSRSYVNSTNSQFSTNAPHISADFPNLLAPGIGKFPDFEHQIVLTDDAMPVARNVRQIPIARRSAVEKEIKQMAEDDIWEKVNRPSAWALNLVTVPKADGNIRVTTDFSPLNRYVVPEQHPLPRISDLYLQLQGSIVFTKLDLSKGYWHIMLAPESRPLTTTITPYGLFQYKRLPMGLTDAASIFQRLVSQTLASCEGCISYLDDILVFGSSRLQHDTRLKTVLERLNENDFRLNVAKCRFAVSDVKFLGHIISSNGIRPDPSNLDAIRRTSIPSTLTEVRSFLGSVNYLREFLPNLAEFAEPLQRLTRTSESTTFEWTTECTTAFDKIKKLLTVELQLAIFDPNRQTVVSTDASNIGLGACLSQIIDGRATPVAFASRTLNQRERAYATNEREALGCVWACEHFANFLLGRHFTLVTDHKALVSILSQSGEGRKAHKFDRWRLQLSEYDYNIVHRPGAENTIADMLSRLPQPDDQSKRVCLVTVSDFSMRQIASATADDRVLASVVERIKANDWSQADRRNVELAPYVAIRDELFVLDGCVMKDNRIVVPHALRKELLKTSHSGHPGIARAKTKLRETYWWPKMSQQIEHFVRQCAGCQNSAKSAPKHVVPSDSIERPSEPWKKIAIDVTGPFATAPSHHRFMIVVIDYFSGFPEIRLCYDHNVTTTIKFLSELFARYGNPDVLVSDNGPEYTSTSFGEFLQARDIIHHRTPVYHPQANGKVEVFNRTLKHHVQTISNGKPFDEAIVELLARYRAERPSPNIPSPAELMFSRRLRLPFEPRRFETKTDSSETDSVADVTFDVSRKETLPPATSSKKSSNKRVCFNIANSTERFVRAPLFRLGDKVRVKKPSVAVRKGESPYSDVLHVTEVLSPYVFRLSDGNVWNACRIRRYVTPSVVYLPISDDERPRIPRRSSRPNRGRPPSRYSPSPR